MTSLSEVYGGGVRTVVDRRRRILAVTLFAAGTAMVAAAVLLATTGVRSWVGYDIVEARHVAGILAGLGLPLAIVGIFAALPASDEMRAAATIGSSVAIFGVLLFAYAYPSRWLSSEPALAIATVAIYTLGILVTFWCLFVAVATFNTRNDPGGTARVEITDEGKIRLVSARPDSDPSPTGGVPSALGLGGVGVLGSDPDGEVPTQTNTDNETDDVQTPESWMEAANEAEETLVGERTATSDGGSAIEEKPVPGAGGAVGERGKPDPYCGNCVHFEYVGVAGEYDPYCGFHQEFMEDLDPCEEWSPNTE